MASACIWDLIAATRAIAAIAATCVDRDTMVQDIP